MNIRLCNMTKELCRRYHEHFAHDPAMFADMDCFTPYVYSPAHADAHWQRQRDLGRVHLAVMLGDEPIGDLVLKNIDRSEGCCTMGIYLCNDSVKNKGYGTQAEMLALKYTFEEMGLNTVYADALHKNKRSQHMLEKVGFQETGRDDSFVYYRCDRDSWIRPDL